MVTVKKGGISESKGCTATVMAKGDAYDTGKNTAKATSENHGPEATDSGCDALAEMAANIAWEKNAYSAGSLVSTMIISKSTEEITVVSYVVKSDRKTTAGGVASMLEHVEKTGVDRHVKDVKCSVDTVKEPPGAQKRGRRIR